ncbi:MAG: c-type cytochrome [Aestuariivita sp.]|nr:c-type cytochrome [Aestuariivita sp.]
MKLMYLLGGLMLAGYLEVGAADLTTGRLVAGMCQTCHGINGFAPIPIAPHIGGEPQSYIKNQLMAYKNSERDHEMMTIIATSLSIQQIEDVAAWYASHTATARLPSEVSEADAPSACISCHGVEGISLVEDAPNLAGEVNIYLATQLKAFRSGKRQHEIMTDIAAELSDDEIRDIANWYANTLLKIERPQ